jgi:hypothetical protein
MLRRAFKKAHHFDHFRKRTRRAFIGMGLLAIGTGVAGFAVGRNWDTESVPEQAVSSRWQGKLPWAQSYATQPIAVLAKHYATFLMVIEQTGGDDATWRGFARLVEHAMDPVQNKDSYLPEALLKTARIAPPPEWLHKAVEELAIQRR